MYDYANYKNKIMTKKQRETRLDKLLYVANSLARSAGVRRMQWREWIIVIDIVMGYIRVRVYSSPTLS